MEDIEIFLKVFKEKNIITISETNGSIKILKF